MEELSSSELPEHSSTARWRSPEEDHLLGTEQLWSMKQFTIVRKSPRLKSSRQIIWHSWLWYKYDFTVVLYTLCTIRLFWKHAYIYYMDVHALYIHSKWLPESASSCSSIFVFKRAFFIIYIYRVIHKSLRDIRPLRYSRRDGHAEGECVNRGRDNPISVLHYRCSICPHLVTRQMSNL